MSDTVELSTACRAAIERAVSAACAEAHRTWLSSLALAPAPHPGRERMDFGSTIRHSVIAVVNSSLSTFCSDLNNDAPVSHLPSELLCYIFEHLDLADRINSSHVCKMWRVVSLAAPAQLWSSIHTSRPDILEARLSRAGSSPLHLQIRVDDATVAAICVLLKRHWNQIHVLSIDNNNNAFQEPVTSLICQPSPHLQAFTYCDAQDELTGVAWQNLFCGEHRSLQLLKLDISPSLLRQQREPLLSVRRLLVRLGGCLPSDIGHIFALFPGLEALALDIFGCPDDDHHPDIYEPPATLKCVRIGCFPVDGDPTAILNCVHFDLMENVIVVFSETVPFDIATSLIPDIRSVTVHYVDHCVNMYFSLANGSRRALMGLSWEAQANIFQHLVVLKISEAAWEIGLPIPPAPHIELLTVYSSLPRHWHRQRAPTVLSDTTGDAEYATLSCPALKHVTFAVRVPSLSDLVYSSDSHTRVNERTVLAAEAVVSFLSRRLDYASPRLEGVLLQGIEVLSISSDGIGRLLLMAKDVRLKQDLAVNESSLDFMFDLLSIQSSLDDDGDSVYTRIV